MKLTCPGCGALIPSENTNVDTGVAKCSACNEVVSVFDVLGLPAPEAGSNPGPVPKSPRIKTQDSENNWTAHWRWFDRSLFGMLFFCIAWDSFLIFWYSLALTKGAPWIAVVFPIAHLSAGIWLTYFVIAGFLNQTTITLTSEALRVRHRPVPWWGNRDLPVESIEQLYCREKRNKGVSSYELVAVLRPGINASEGSEVKLATLPDLPEARYLEQQVERRVGITHRRITGECPV